MSDNLFTASLAIITAVAFGTLGFIAGAGDKQNTIVQECREYNVYTDRLLVLECSVHEPRK